MVVSPKSKISAMGTDPIARALWWKKVGETNRPKPKPGRLVQPQPPRDILKKPVKSSPKPRRSECYTPLGSVPRFLFLLFRSPKQTNTHCTHPVEGVRNKPEGEQRRKGVISNVSRLILKLFLSKLLENSFCSTFPPLAPPSLTSSSSPRYFIFRSFSSHPSNLFLPPPLPFP